MNAYVSSTQDIISVLQILAAFVVLFRSHGLRKRERELDARERELDKVELWLDRREMKLEEKIDKLRIVM